MSPRIATARWCSESAPAKTRILPGSSSPSPARPRRSPDGQPRRAVRYGLELGGDRRPDGARLDHTDRTAEAVEAARTRVVVHGNTSLVGEVFAVQQEHPVRVVQPEPQVHGVIARQLGARIGYRDDRAADYLGGRREIARTRANVAPGSAGKHVEVAEGGPGV